MEKARWRKRRCDDHVRTVGAPWMHPKIEPPCRRRSRLGAEGEQSMALTWQGSVVGAGLLAFGLYSAWGGYADGREAERRATLGVCGLASSYVEWRVTFDASQRGATRIEGEAFTTFVRESGLFERAANRLRESSPPATQAQVLSRLHSIAAHDSNRANDTVASSELFLDAFFTECGTEAAAIAARFVN
jgi:hypothetical protein